MGGSWFWPLLGILSASDEPPSYDTTFLHTFGSRHDWLACDTLDNDVSLPTNRIARP